MSTQRKFSFEAWVSRKAKLFAFLEYPSNPSTILKNKEKEDDLESHPLFLYLSGVKDATANDFALTIEGILTNWDSVKANLDRVHALMV